MNIEHLFEYFSNLSDEELARNICEADSNENRFLIQVYLLNDENKSKRIQALLNKNSELQGAFLEGYLG